MNIHLTDYDVQRCAANLDNLRLASAVKENAQMLCSAALLHYDVKPSLVLWRPTHFQHPCTQWLCASTGNVDWIMRYTGALIDQQQKAGYKPMLDVLVQVMQPVADAIYHSIQKPHAPLTQHANCARRIDMNIDHHAVADTVLAYRGYMAQRWEAQLWKQQPVQWRDGYVPQWLFDDKIARFAPTLTSMALKHKKNGY